MSECTYYNSDEWAEKRENIYERIKDMRTLIWDSTYIDDTEDAIQEIVKNTKYSRDELGEVNKDEFLDNIDENNLKYSDKIRDSKFKFLQVPSNCPHKAVEGTNRCIFHLDPNQRRDNNIDKDQVDTELLNKIKKPGENNKVFAGAVFEDLDLSQQEISSSDNYPIHLEGCEFQGDTTLERSVIDQPFIANGLTTDEITFQDAQFNKDAEFIGSHFKDNAKFKYALFKSDAEFWNAEFKKEASFYACKFQEYAEFRNTLFSEVAQFKYSTIERDIEFWDANFNGKANIRCLLVENAAEFRNSCFKKKAEFNNMRVKAGVEYNFSEFHESVDFQNITISENTYFHNTKFLGAANFESSEFGGHVEFHPNDKPEESGGAIFKGKATFQNSVFNKDAEFWGVEFKNEANFDKCDFNGPSEFHYVTFHGDVSLDNTSHAKVYFVYTDTKQAAIKITNSSIASGKIIKPRRSEVLYDMKQSEIGDIDIVAEDGTNIFSFLRFYRTDFIDFDFSSYREDLNKSWKIHKYETGSLEISTDEDTNKYAELEATYLKAKNGAANVGDSKAASEFFLLERIYQRKYQEIQMINSDDIRNNLKHMYNFTSSWLFNLTCGYGERPFRTVSFGVSIILVYSIIYQYVLDFRGPETFIKYTTLSIQTFVSFLFGGLQPEDKSVLMQFLTSSEAFIGGFTVALFVFALTRSVQR